MPSSQTDSNLIRLGFADFVADRKAQSADPATPLFGAIPSAPSRSPAEYASDSFRRFCQDVKVYQRWRDFHAFRTTLNSSLRAAEPALDSSLILGILGHEANDVNVKHYTVHKPAALRRAIESVGFPAAQSLPRVYRRSEA